MPNECEGSAGEEEHTKSALALYFSLVILNSFAPPEGEFLTDAQSLDDDVGNKGTLETRKRNGSEVFGNSTQADLHEKNHWAGLWSRGMADKSG